MTKVIIQLLFLLFVASSFRACHGNMRHNTFRKIVHDVNCSIKANASDIREFIGEALNNRKRMIKFNIDMSGDSGTFFETVPENTIYRPHEWILTTDETARRLLMLPEDFVPRSLFTLSFDVEYIQLTFQQIPKNCVGNMNLSTVQSMLQHNILKNFSDRNFDVGEKQAVCNRQIAHQNIKYNCCWMSYENLEVGELKCKELNEDDSVKTFMLVQNVIVYIAALYCPLLLPSFLFKKRKIEFWLDFKEWTNYVTATFKSLQDSDRTSDKHTQKIPTRGIFDQVNNGETRKVILRKVTIKTDLDNLMEEGSSHYAASKYFWDTFVILKTFSNVTIGKNDKKLIDNIYFKYFMYIYRSLIIMVISLSPLVLVYIFYFMYGMLVVEYDEEISRVHDIPIATPSEIEFSFIFGPIPDLCMYIAVFVTFCLLQIWSDFVKNYVLKTSDKSIVKDYFLKTIHKSIKYMHMSFGQFRYKINEKIENSLKKELGIEKNKIKKNIENMEVKEEIEKIEKKIKGKCDKIVCMIYIIFVIFSIFPLAQFILLQVIFNIISFKKSITDGSLKRDVGEIMILTVWQAFTLFLLIWYVTICTVYVVSFSVYSLLGCLLHFEDVFRYIIFISLIIVYGYNCFNEVTEKYRKFLNIIKGSIYKKITSKKMKSLIQNIEQNSAYFVPMTEQDFTLEIQELNDEKVIRVKMNGLLLFIENIDKIVQYIPVSFFNEMISCTHAACPGKPHILYMKALKRFCLVVLFLLYTYMIIFAMGEAHDIPSGVQTLVGLGAGFLPFAFKHFILKSRKYSLKDIKSDLLWEELFDKTLENFQDNWTFKNDIELDDNMSTV